MSDIFDLNACGKHYGFAIGEGSSVFVANVKRHIAEAGLIKLCFKLYISILAVDTLLVTNAVAVLSEHVSDLGTGENLVAVFVLRISLCREDDFFITSVFKWVFVCCSYEIFHILPQFNVVRCYSAVNGVGFGPSHVVGVVITLIERCVFWSVECIIECAQAGGGASGVAHGDERD